MKLILKFGGTSLASPKDINNVAKTVASFSKDNEIVVVCSAVDGVTDDLLLISKMIEQRKKDDVTKALDEIIKKHRNLANQTIQNPAIKKTTNRKTRRRYFGTTGIDTWTDATEGSFSSFAGLFDFFW